jgi:hypothetical protein
MRKLHRYIPAGLTGGAVATALTSIVLFIKGIWTPQWQTVHGDDGQGFTGCQNACYVYQANHQWLATAWVFVIVTLMFVIARIVLWRIENEENHGH